MKTRPESTHTDRPKRSRQDRKTARRDQRAARKTARTARPQAAPIRTLTAFRRTAIIGITLAIWAMTIDAFAESYRGLYEWASNHAMTGFWAASFPLMIDGFILVGELVLIVALADRWPWWDRLMAWAAVLLGLAASVGGNIGHVHSGLWTTRATAAIPPLAASGALALGLAVLKRVAGGQVGQAPRVAAYVATMAARTPDPVPAPAVLPEPQDAATAVPAPAMGELEAPGSPAADSSPLDLAHLASLDSAAKRARYAAQVIGTGSAAAVAGALTAAGYPTDRQAARSGLRDRRPDASVHPLRREANRR